MSCGFALDDGAYVVGALSAADRQAFERHLPRCADCARAVGELAGLPGLLGRFDAGIVEEAEVDDPVPATLLPALVREVRRSRRHRTRATVGMAAAAAVAVVAATVGLTVTLAGRDDTAARAGAGESSSPAAPAPTGPRPRPMQPVGDVPVRATVVLEQVAWGTRLELTCTYDPQSVEYELPRAVDYTLYVRTEDGGAERVGSWRSVAGRPVQFAGGTSAGAGELASVEVRTTDGRVVLRLAT